MGGEIFQLALVASRRRGVETGAPHEQEQQMVNSRAAFAAANVTGLALVKGPRLLYHLEGEEQQVMSLFHRIESDPRIHGIVVLRRRFVKQRAFAKWNFAVDSKPTSLAAKPLVKQVEQFVAEAPSDVAQYFLSFAKLETTRVA